MVAVMLALFVLATWHRADTALAPTVRTAGEILWRNHRLYQIGLCLLAGYIFWICRAQTHFLGDGYTIRSNYGIAGPFVGSVTAPLATLAAKSIQSLLGANDRPGIQASFQILSVLSGVICLFNFTEIARYLVADPIKRLLVVSALIFSGAMLLFFGYVEYYPLLWAGATTCVSLSIRYLHARRGYWLALFSYPLVAAIHIEGLILAPGVLYLIADRLPSRVRDSLHRWRFVHLGAAAIIGIIALAYWRHHDITVARLTLPWFFAEGKAGSVFTLAHLRDLGNLMLLVIPGVSALIVWAFERRAWPQTGRTLEYLCLVSLGCGAFLFVASPDLGMARDWDLFSLALFPPSLLLLLAVVSPEGSVSARELLGFTLVTGVMTAVFLTVSLTAVSAENRFESLIRESGTRNRGGWVILQRYFENKGDLARAQTLKSDIERIFPSPTAIDRGYELLQRRQTPEAVAIAREEIEADRFNADAWNLLGTIFLKQGVEDSAVAYLETADKLSPYDPRLKNLLGQALLKTGRIDEALATLKEAKRLDPSLTVIDETIALAHITRGDVAAAIEVANSLLRRDLHDAGGHLILLTVCASSGQMAEAALHYQEFARYGTKRSDYKAICETYRATFAVPTVPAPVK